MREAQFAGLFYPEDKKELKKQVKGFLVFGKRGNIRAGISPHAGYVYSGKVAGQVYSLIPEKKDFIILGVNHSGIGKKITFSLEDWQTPLGTIKTNKALAKKFLEKLRKEGLEADISEIAHKEEHSIEVQLPFLQLTQDRFEIVPILLADLSFEECQKIAGILADFIKDKEIVIASSDFTHYGRNYGFMPFDNGKDIYKFDNVIILNILKNDSQAFYSLAKKSTVCGIYSVTILTEISRIKGWNAKLLKYSTSAEVAGTWDSVVGYAGLVFE